MNPTPYPALTVGRKLLVDGTQIYLVEAREDRQSPSGGTLPYLRLSGPDVGDDYWQAAASVQAWIDLGSAQLGEVASPEQAAAFRRCLGQVDGGAAPA